MTRHRSRTSQIGTGRVRARTRVAAIAVSAVLAVTGCSGLPTKSAVQPGLEVGAPDVEIPRVQLRPPAPGAQPADIIAGFMDAASSSEDDFAAARAYLTGAAARTWEPGDQVTVYPESAVLTPRVADGSATLRMPVTARLDDTGRYQVADEGEVVTSTLGLQRVDGEWRISSLPDKFGLWLSAEWFTYLYRRSSVSYVDPFERTLVRDPRWVSSRRSGPTALGEAQLDPVPPYLRGAAVSGFPNGTALGVKSVPVTDGVAQVELTEQATNATVDQRKAAWAQMLRTMRQWPGVRAISMTVDGDMLPLLDEAGEPMNLTELPTSITALGYEESQVTLAAVVLRTKTYLAAQDFTGWLRGGENLRSVEAALPEVPASWQHIAVGPDVVGERRHVAAVDDTHSHLMRWTAQGSGTAPSFGSHLTEPAVDARDQAWVGGRDERGAPAIWFVPVGAALDAAPTPIEAGWLEGTVTAVKPSPGGRRLAVALTDAKGRTSVFVAGLAVGQGRGPVALAQPWRVATGLTQMRDLTWVGDTSLAVLAGRSGSPVTPAIIRLGDEVEALQPVADAAQVVSAGIEGGVLVVTEGGIVWRRAGAQSWQRIGTAEQVIIPGA